jgi:sphingomyelin phosphodiesterase 2
LNRGLKFVAKNREERIEAIAHELSTLNHDIIALQEIWVYSDYQKVQERVSKRLPHAKFFYRCAGASRP